MKYMELLMRAVENKIPSILPDRFAITLMVRPHCGLNSCASLLHSPLLTILVTIE